MAMVDMKRAKSKKSDGPMMHEDNGYHHGLTVHLGHEELSKLGMKELPKVGSKIPMKAHAHVKEVRDGGKGDRHVSLELRKMELAAEKKASEQDIHEGKLRGAKAAMDQALDKQEGTEPEGDEDE
jgi:hypothetical protein